VHDVKDKGKTRRSQDKTITGQDSHKKNKDKARQEKAWSFRLPDESGEGYRFTSIGEDAGLNPFLPLFTNCEACIYT
jgi:hypothetical protein